MVTYNPRPAENLYTVKNKEQVTLLFFDTEDAEGLTDHLAIYKRFAEAFADTDEVLVLNINSQTVIEFENYGYYYFNNDGSKLKSGMILSNGVDMPIIEANPEKYIKRYEDYFGVPFNDKVYYGQKRKAEIATHQTEAEKLLKERVKIDNRYATQLITNSNTSFYPKKVFNQACRTGKVIIQLFEDSVKTKKGAVQIETVYNSEGQIKSNTTLINGVAYANEIYYRNAYQLIDSIVKIDEKGLKSKSVFKYGKNQYAIVSIDGPSIMTSGIFYLNDKFQCVKKETLNGSGDVVRTTACRYDDRGRIIEEVSEDQRLVYEYKNRQDEFYASLKSYNTKTQSLMHESTRLDENGKVIFINKANNKILSTSVSVNDLNGCTKTVYNYNGDLTINEVYAYYYEN